MFWETNDFKNTYFTKFFVVTKHFGKQLFFYIFNDCRHFLFLFQSRIFLDEYWYTKIELKED